MRKEAPETTTAASFEKGRAPVRIREVRVLFSPAPPKRNVALLESEPVVVGRDSDEGIGLPIADREISRRHAVFEREGDAWFVRDCGSRNGVYVGGVRRDRTELVSGSIVRVGRALLLYQELLIRSADTLKPATRILGPSLAMQRVRGEISLIAPRNVPVLILGETGAGKELVAEELHAQSGRSGRFVSVNCAALPHDLAESELFGHVAGAFTGSVRRSEGLFAAANGGTFFLDEIGEMPPLVQPKILRALAKGEVRPVGAQESFHADVRIVAATHRDLADESSPFRRDLFARLAGWTIRVPPLRERREDILPLAQAFLAKEDIKLSVEAAEALLLHDYPYNVRELQQTIQAAAVRAATSGGLLRAQHLPEELAGAIEDREAAGGASEPPAEVPLEALVSRDAPPSKADLVRVLERFGGNVAQVAEYFRKDRQQIYRWARRLDVDLASYR